MKKCPCRVEMEQELAAMDEPAEKLDRANGGLPSWQQGHDMLGCPYEKQQKASGTAQG